MPESIFDILHFHASGRMYILEEVDQNLLRTDLELLHKRSLPANGTARMGPLLYKCMWPLVQVGRSGPC